MKIDLRVPPCMPVQDVADFVKDCETAGFDGVGILDSQMLERDVFVSMAMAAQATSGIRIASAVLNPVTRHISVLGSAIKTVSETAPGRVEFWIGRGFSSVQTVGIAPASVRQMRRCVITLKNLLAGEVADGVLLQVGLDPGSLDLARKHLAIGAERSGRDPNDIEIILCATTIIMNDQKEAREVARPLCVQRLVETSHRPYLEAAGIFADHLDIPSELNDLYPDIPHAEDWDRAKQLCSFLPEDILIKMCDALGLIGTPEYCVERIKKAASDGINHLYLMTSESYQFPKRELEAFQTEIFPALGNN